MYYYLNGTVAHYEQDLVVLDVGGIGYACHTTLATIARLTIGTPVKLYTHLQVKEDAQDIYAFFSLEEKACFLRLISVSGVGPRSALNILSICTPDQLALAVATEDDKALTQAAGVGKKMAQRIILELKDKLAQLPQDSGIALPSTIDIGVQSNLRQAQAALQQLGYTPSEAGQAVKGLNAEDSVEHLLSAALKKLV
ncbi:MAG: Holliday junction branch migration protein RuvA [Oscillospiraceae bacterium]|nr:Holliday junction branch migration protein RuvA [Oscillospiraceae bacterium]